MGTKTTSTQEAMITIAQTLMRWEGTWPDSGGIRSADIGATLDKVCTSLFPGDYRVSQAKARAELQHRAKGRLVS